MVHNVITKLLLISIVGFHGAKKTYANMCDSPQSGRDLHAENLKSVNNRPLDSCCDECLKTAGCTGYAWNDFEGGTCWLKSGVGPLVPTANVFAAIRRTVEPPDVKCDSPQNGHDLHATNLKAVSNRPLNACCKECLNANGCTGYAWNDFDGGTCWLKSGIGSLVPTPNVFAANVRKGDLPGYPRLIFEDNFDNLDTGKWRHEITAGGGGNGEFQWYSNDKKNSFTRNGNLYIKPTLTADTFGEDFVWNGKLDLWKSGCNLDMWNGCLRQAGNGHIINPVQSAKITTVNSFSFRYGRIEVEAKMPTGDWLWPAIWMLPKDYKYGGWPASGEIDIVESRGNVNLRTGGRSIGVDEMGSTMHWGPRWPFNAFPKTGTLRHAANGATFGNRFHKYRVDWGPDFGLKFFLNDELIMTVNPPNGFWAYGKDFWKDLPDSENPWKNGGRLTPFDQPFYIILNVAVGGTNFFFPDDVTNQNYPKPWKNNAPFAQTDFYRAKNNWYSTWKGDDSAMQINYIRVWKLGPD